MNTNRISKWVTTGVVGLSALAALAGTATPTLAQGFGQYGDRHVFRGARLAANAGWSEVDKTPHFGTNSQPGFYVWRQGDEVFVVANTPNWRENTHTSGDVVVPGGSVVNVQGYRTGPEDRFRQVANNRLVFSLNTGSDLDGVKFHVNGGRRIVINLQGGGPQMQRVFLGQDKIESFQNPIVIEK